ncbi:hypothetical protein CVM73_30625 [Bradyrhizobium forestalis]|uniref:Uncharacterized protein n=1 Tax=Bradyrhizobium forestalis TaxID=1419263 RepID=A0A2M8R151_9BRAD|nr:hypothetical protein CVM73_30625 [Bradyrhizobium forestalis]
MRVESDRRRAGGALPLPLAGEGRGEGFLLREIPDEERTLSRRCAPTSPASGRGYTERAARLIRLNGS